MLTFLRRNTGLGIVVFAWIISVFAEKMLHFGAWLMDEEERSRKIDEFMEERDARNPIPDFDQD